MSYDTNRFLIDRSKARAKNDIGEAAWSLLGPGLQRAVVAEYLLKSLADGEAPDPGYADAKALALSFRSEKI